MSEDERSELANACRQSPASSTESVLEVGVTITLMGRPSHADEGYVSLLQSEGLTVTIRMQDIVEVVKDRSVFLVRVRSHSQVVCRFEQVVEILDPRTGDRTKASGGCGCEPGSGSGPGMAQQPADGGGGDFGCSPECWFETVCVNWADENSFLHRVCIPLLNCRMVCQPVA